MHTILLLIAKYLFIVVGLFAFAYWLRVSRQEKVRLVLFGVIAGIVTFALVKIGAALYYDPRPFVTEHVTPLFPHGSDNGFPSDHTVLTAFVALTIFSSSKRIGLVSLAMSVLIGVSRIIGHIHSPIDILGSLMFAFIGFTVATLSTPPILKRIKSHREYMSPK